MTTSRRPRVLIVDDSATHRLRLQLMLGERYELAHADDGEAALERAAAFAPDLVLLDVVMPRMDGLAACRALRQRKPSLHTPVILVTSQHGEWDVEAGYESGCTDYIAKPVDQEELLTKIESWLAVAASGGPGA